MIKKVLFLLTLCLCFIFPISNHAQIDLAIITPGNVADVQYLGAIGAEQIFDVAWSPDSTQLAVIGDNGIRIYNPDDLSESPRWLIPACKDSYRECYGSLQYKSDGGILITGTNNEIIFWNTETWEISAHYQNEEMDMSTFAYDFENERLIYGGRYPNPWTVLQTPIRADLANDDPITLTYNADDYDSYIFSEPNASDIVLSADSRFMGLSYAVVNFEDDSFPDSTHNIALWDIDAVFTSLTPAVSNMIDIGSDAELQEFQNNLVGHSEAVRQLSLNSDDSMLASAGLDHTIRLWSLPDGVELATLEGHQAAVWDVAFNPHSNQVASVSWDATLRFWDLINKAEEQRVQFNSALTTVSYHPDGSRVAIGTWDGILAIVDTTSGEILQQRAGVWSPVWQIVFSPDGNFMATAMNNGEVILWNRLDQFPYFEIQQRFQEHEGAVYTVAFNPDGTLLASAGRTNSIHIRDLTTGELTQTFIHPDGTIYDLGFSPYDDVLVSSSWYGSVFFWNLESGRMRSNPIYSSDPVYSIDFHPQENWMAYGDTIIARSGQYISNTILNIETPRYWSDSYGSDRSQLEFSPDGTQLLNSSGLSTYIWNLDDLLEGSPRLQGFATFNPLSEMFVIAPAAERITFYSTETFEPLAEHYFQDELPYRTSYLTPLRYIAFTPDAMTVLSAGIDGRIHLWGIP